jgi:hypothetical protein
MSLANTRDNYLYISYDCVVNILECTETSRHGEAVINDKGR